MFKITTFKNYEERLSFSDKWYSIFLNPFYITRKQLRRAVSSFATSLNESDVVLDIGCGSKPYRDLFRVKKYLGIDVRGGGLRDKVKKVDKYFDGQKIPYPSSSFSVVIATEVLEHAKNPERLAAEMYRVLKGGGRLFITMPFVWPEHGIPYDFQRYTSFKHRRLLTDLGFKRIAIKPTTGVFGTCGQVISDFMSGYLGTLIWKSSLRYGFKFLLTRLVVLIICFPIQLLFDCLDILAKRQGLTLDFVVEAQK